FSRDWSSDVCSSDLRASDVGGGPHGGAGRGRSGRVLVRFVRGGPGADLGVAARFGFGGELPHAVRGVGVAAGSDSGVGGDSRRRGVGAGVQSEEHTSELQSRENLVCRLLLEKKKNI